MAYNKKAHLRDNIEAIRLMFRLEKEQRTATTEEAGTLAAYSGFGGIKAVLSPFGKLTDILRWTQAGEGLPAFGKQLQGHAACAAFGDFGGELVPEDGDQRVQR